MHEYEYDLAVYIGRFQPFHKGHSATIKNALNLARNVLVLVGSSYSARSYKNPFTFSERKRMIEDVYPFEAKQASTLRIEPIIDTVYNENAWISQVRFKASEVLSGNTKNKKIAIVGHSKGDSSYYLKSFPDWNFVEQEAFTTRAGVVLNATDIRFDMFFGNGQAPGDVCPFVPHTYISKEAFGDIKADQEYIDEYKKSWENSPFPPTFNCSDAVVIQSGHVLLVQRGGRPGYGQYAIPGGFIDPNETALKASIRELREETKLKVPEKVLNGSIFAQHVFDDPSRSTRGRTFSHAFGFKLDDSLPLPEVRGGDDAAKAMWAPFEVIRQNHFREKMFEDHASILDWFLARV